MPKNNIARIPCKFLKDDCNDFQNKAILWVKRADKAQKREMGLKVNLFKRIAKGRYL